MGATAKAEGVGIIVLLNPAVPRHFPTLHLVDAVIKRDFDFLILQASHCLHWFAAAMLLCQSVTLHSGLVSPT